MVSLDGVNRRLVDRALVVIGTTTGQLQGDIRFESGTTDNVGMRCVIHFPEKLHGVRV